MPSYFVTSTGTDIGKTAVTAALTSQLRKAGRPVTALKPVITGFEPGVLDPASDTAILLNAMGREQSIEQADLITPWRYRKPLSPDMAAARDGKVIDFDALVAWCKKEESKVAAEEILFFEGAGGLLVPIDDSHVMRDWITALSCPAILVVGSYLGTISHSLTALEALAAKNIQLQGVVISESLSSPVPMQETAEAIKRFAAKDFADLRFAFLPRQDDPETAWKTAPDLVTDLGL